MHVIETIQNVRTFVRRARDAGRSVGLVPTMGALHEGHASLIARSCQVDDVTVVSIFVNPTQFAPSEDLESYPRPIEQDLALCGQLGVEAVFHPSVEQMYPRECLTRVDVPALGRGLCGRSRADHFAGVCTVVMKLLNIVQPDAAYFGAKDYQQAAIIRRMVEDLNVPVRIEVCPTIREPDGLACASRNAYLTKAERVQAPALHAALAQGAEMIRESRPPAWEAVAAMREHLAEQAPDGRIDYVEAVDAQTLEPVEDTSGEVLLAVAIRLGEARLIDNVLVPPVSRR